MPMFHAVLRIDHHQARLLQFDAGQVITQTLKALAKDHGHTVVVVTHDNRIFHLADRIVHIEDGLIVEKS